MLPAKTHEDPILAKYLAMPLPECREAIFAFKKDVGQRLLHWGKAVRAYKINGGNVDDLGMNGMTHWLLMVGGDELYAPIVAMFIREKKMIRRLSALPFDDQKNIGDGGTVDLLVMDRGKPTTLAVKVADVNDSDVLDQLLASDHIRSVAEQRIWLESKKAQAAMPIPERIGNLAPDQERDGCEFLGKRGDFISADTLRAAYLACRKKGQ